MIVSKLDQAVSHSLWLEFKGIFSTEREFSPMTKWLIDHLAKSLSVRLRTNLLWVRVPLLSLKL